MTLRPVRTVLFWSHLTAGVLAGIVILIMSATGAILALKPQIMNRIDREVRFVNPESAARLPPSLILAVVRAMRPDAAPTAITVDRDPSASVSVALGRSGTLYVNPYTGAALGSASERAEAFFRAVENWHRWLAATGETRLAARAVTGAANLAFLLLAVTGLYVWWPRKWTPQHTAPILVFRRTTTGRARDFNWHNVIGFWCAPAIIVMTGTATVMSYSWANGLLFRAMGSQPPSNTREARPAERGTSGGPRGDRPERPAGPALTAEQIDRSWAQAESQLPTWSTISVRQPNGGGPLGFTLTDSRSWNAFARSQLAIDTATG